MELLDVIKKAVEGPFGPSESESAKHLLNKKVLFAKDKEGLGYYGTLLSIDSELESPYLVSISAQNNRRARTNWIVFDD